MANIRELLAQILSARYGKDVRQSIHDAIETCYEDGKAATIATTEMAGIVKPDGKSITVDADGTLHGANQVTIESASAETHELPTSKGGLWLDKVVGKSVKSYNLLSTNSTSIEKEAFIVENNVNMKANTSYTLSLIGSINAMIFFSVFYSDGTKAGDIASVSTIANTKVNKTITLAKDVIKLSLWATKAGTYNDIMLNEGTEALPYMPYGIFSSGEIADGAIPSKYAEVITEHGKNLWNPNNSKIQSYGTVNNRACQFFDKPNTYTFSHSGGNVVNIAYNVYNNTTKTTRYSSSPQIGRKFTETVGNDEALIIFGYNGMSLLAFNNTIPNAQMEIGTEASDYIPYESHTSIIPLTTPLYSVGDIHDYLDENGEHHYIGSVDMGTINWAYDNGVFYQAISGRKNGYYNILCDRYEVAYNVTQFADMSDMQMIGNANATHVFIKDSNYTDKDTFKSAMSGKLLYFELATPTHTPLTLDQIKAMRSLEAYKEKTYVDSADEYAKAELTLEYSQSDVGSLAIENKNGIAYNKALMEQYNANLQAMVLELETQA